jgi:hypothetical protein
LRPNQFPFANVVNPAANLHNDGMSGIQSLPLAFCLVTAMALTGCSGPAAPAPPEVAPIDIPTGESAMAPNLATGPDGALVLSWIDVADTADSLQFSRWQDNTWSAPATVASGDNWFVNWADFPSVVPLTNDLWGAHWLVSQPEGGYAYDVTAAFSMNGGRDWSEPFIPHTDNTPTEHGFVTLFPDAGGMGLVWLDGRKMVNEWDENDVTASGMTLRAATFGTDGLPISESLVDGLICDCCQTDIALTPEGPIAVYRNRTTEEVRDIYVSRREFGEWQPGVPVATDNWEIPACPVNGPVIRSRDSTAVVAWFTAVDDRPVVKVAWSIDSAKTFSDPVELDIERPLGHVGAALLPDGDLVVSWHRSAGQGGASLMLRRVSQDGTIGAPYQLSEAIDVFAFSVPQLASVGEDLIAAWTTEESGNFRIRSALIPGDLIPR